MLVAGHARFFRRALSIVHSSLSRLVLDRSVKNHNKNLPSRKGLSLDAAPSSKLVWYGPLRSAVASLM